MDAITLLLLIWNETRRYTTSLRPWATKWALPNSKSFVFLHIYRSILFDDVRPKLTKTHCLHSSSFLFSIRFLGSLWLESTHFLSHFSKRVYKRHFLIPYGKCILSLQEEYWNKWPRIDCFCAYQPSGRRVNPISGYTSEGQKTTTPINTIYIGSTIPCLINKSNLYMEFTNYILCTSFSCLLFEESLGTSS